MSSLNISDHEQKRQDNLEALYSLREDLKTIAESEAEYAEYAEAGLKTLREEGYDV